MSRGPACPCAHASRRCRAKQRRCHERVRERFALIQQFENTLVAGSIKLGDQFQSEADGTIGEPSRESPTRISAFA